MAHNSKKNKRHIPILDGDDYVYPTKKSRNRSKSRRSDKELIQAGLDEFENPSKEGTNEEDY